MLIYLFINCNMYLYMSAEKFTFQNMTRHHGLTKKCSELLHILFVCGT